MIRPSCWSCDDGLTLSDRLKFATDIVNETLEEATIVPSGGPIRSIVGELLTWHEHIAGNSIKRAMDRPMITAIFFIVVSSLRFARNLEMIVFCSAVVPLSLTNH